MHYGLYDWPQHTVPTHTEGDISYARGTALIWEQYFALVEPIAETIPYMVSIGTVLPFIVY